MMKHGLRLPPFWQTPCYMQPCRSVNQLTVSNYLGWLQGSVGQMKLLGLVGFCADGFVRQPQVLYLQHGQVS